MIGEILVKTLTCLLMSPLFLACWRGMINLIYLFIYIYISPILAILFNRFLQVGTFPDVLKISKLIPIYKSGAKNELSNYRPI